MHPPDILFAVLVMSTTFVLGAPIAYGICQAGCAAVVTACYADGGAIHGVALGAQIPAAIAGCNSAFGTCQAACHVVAWMPMPLGREPKMKTCRTCTRHIEDMNGKEGQY